MGLLGIYLQKSASAENDQWERSGTRTYIVAFDTGSDENYVRANLGATYIINYPHPSDAGQVVANISVQQATPEVSKFSDPTNPANTNNGADCYWWDVEITYGPWDPLTHTATGDPADQPVDISFQWQTYEQAVDVAWNPSTSAYVPVVNSAGDPFDPPVTREALKGVMRVAYNSHTFAPATYFAYGNCINADVWNGFPIGSIKVTPPAMPQRLYSQYLGENYYRLEFEFCFYTNNSAGGWNAYPIDRGFRALNGSSQLYNVLDVNGQPVSQPVLLNGSGAPLAFSSIDSGFYQFNFQIYNSITFATTFPNLTTLF